MVLSLAVKTNAQIPIMGGPDIDIGGINYSNVPDLGGVEVINYGADFSFAKPLSKGMLGFRLNYQNFDFSFDQSTNIIDTSSYENMNLIGASIFYRLPLKNSWSVIASVGSNMISNFEGDITSEDFVFNAIGMLSKRWGDQERNSVLSFGILYGTQFGQPTLLPVASFRQKLNAHWSYTLGLPITGINFQINKKNRLSFSLRPQGIYGNNSGTVAFQANNTLENSKLQFNALRAGLSYRYKFTSFLSVLIEGGYLPTVQLKILDQDNNEIYDFDPDTTSYFNVGLRFGLNKKPGNNSKNNTNEN